MNEFEKQAIERLEGGGFKKDVAGVDYENIAKSFADMVQVPKIGLLYIGGVGCGKTHAMKTLAPNATFFDLTDPVTNGLLKPYEKWDKVNEQLSEKWWTIEAMHTVILDDMGNEPIKNNYGNIEQVVADFIMRWHVDIFKCEDCRARFHATSNLTEEQLIARYGARVTDRLFEMVNIVHFHGKSKRTPGKVYG